MTIYTTGTVSVTNGDAVVTGSGTAWAVALIAGGIFSSAGVSVPILSVDSDTSLTLAYDWPGTTATGAVYAIARENSEAADIVDLNDRLNRVLVTLSLAGITPNDSGTIAERDALTLAVGDKGFLFLHAELGYDFEFYRWNGSAWDGPFATRGVAGASGLIGIWRGPWLTATSYYVNDAVSQGGSSYICVTAHTSGTFATDLAASKWQLVAQKGDTGAAGTNGTNGAPGVVQSIVAGSNVTVDNTDPANPIVSASGGGAVSSVAGLTGAIADVDLRNALDAAPYVTSRTALKALDTTKDTVAVLTESGREGVFVWRTGNYSTQVAADTLEGVYVKATAIASSSGAWVRVYDGPLQVEWFGAAPNATTDSQPAIQAAYALLVAITGTTEGSVGRIEAKKGKYRLGSSLTFSYPVGFFCPSYLEYTPTTGSALIIGAAAPTGGRNTGYDIDIGGLRAINGNTTSPTGVNSSGTSGVEIRNAQFSRFKFGRIIAFTKYGFWGNQSNNVYTGQHCQDNTIWLSDVAYCGTGIYVESVSAANGAFQVNEIHVQNSFANWINFRIGPSGDTNSNNNLFLFNAADADTGGGNGFVRGGYNTFRFGYVDGTIAFETGSVYNWAYAQVGKAQVTFTDAGTRNDLVNAVEGRLSQEWWESTADSTPAINLVSKSTSTTFSEVLALRRRKAGAAANDGGVSVGAYFWDDAGSEVLGGRIRTDMPSVASAGTNYNLRWLFDTVVGGTLANRMILWQGLSLGSSAADQGSGTVNVSSDYFISASPLNPSPVTKTADFTVGVTENNIICNKGSTLTITLPSAASFPRRRIRIKTIQAFTVVSASSNVVPMTSATAGTAILAATAGKWADLQSDGANWVIMAGN